MESWGVTHSGKVRSINQDVYKILVSDDNGIAALVVCDGMGGANAGNIASKIAAETFTAYISANTARITKCLKLDDIADIVTDAVTAANNAVYKMGMEDAQYHGMGTTLVALVSSHPGEIVANIGDSRAYHITPRGISQVTKDHSVVEDMIDRGEITRVEAEHHPRKNLITRAIGADEDVEPDIFMQSIDAGDIVLLCTDGLSNLVTEDEITEEIKQNKTLRQMCNALTDKSLDRGAPDNVTIAIFRK